jgi:hypothetical protein
MAELAAAEASLLIGPTLQISGGKVLSDPSLGELTQLKETGQL